MALNQVRGKQIKPAVAGNGLGVDADGNMIVLAGNGTEIIADYVQVKASNQRISVTSEGVTTGLNPAADDLQYIHVLGFTDRSAVSLSLTGTDKDTLQIEPVSTSYDYYYKGERVTISTTKTIQLPGSPHTDGTHFVYFNDNAGTLATSTTPWDLYEHVPIASMFWYQGNAEGSRVLHGDELHTCRWPKSIHRNCHLTRGTQKTSGGAISGYTLSTDTDAAKTWAISAATIEDEDIVISIGALTDGNGTGANNTIFYKTSGSWAFTQGNNFGFNVGGAGKIQYNSGANGLVECTNNYSMNTYIIFSNFDGEARHINLLGQAEYQSINDAYAETLADLSLTGFSLQEFVAVYQVTWTTSSSYTSTGKCVVKRIVPLDISAIKLSGSLTSADHNSTYNRDVADSHPATAVSTVTTNFDKNLSSSDTDVQLALDTLNSLTKHVYYTGTVTNNVATEIYINGVAATRYTVAASSTAVFHFMGTARDTTNNICKVWEFKGGIKRDGSNNTTVIGTVTKTVICADNDATTWDLTVSADDTNESVKVEVTGDTGRTIVFIVEGHIIDIS